MSRTVGRNALPVQQALTASAKDYAGLNITRLMQGIVLEVNPSDSNRNRSAIKHVDRRGQAHTATVLITQDARPTQLTLDNVVITPDSVSGLDSYYERLPRGCSSLITGAAYSAQLNVNPDDLDGDRCVVGFIGGSINLPFIVRWWPHPRNTYDPATSGVSIPRSRSNERTIDQTNRHFQRVNGVEFVVSKTGNIYLSTYRANSTLSFGEDLTPEEGRFPRTLNDDVGGSFKAWIKPSQAFELDFNTPVNGIGVMDAADDALPQTNPANRSNATGDKPNTYLLIEKDRVLLETSDEINLSSKSKVLISSDEDSTLTVGGDLSVSVTGDSSLSTSNLGISVTQGLDLDVTGNTDVDLTGTADITILSTLNLQVTGPTTIQSNSTLNIGATGVLALSGSSISFGASGSSGGPGSINVSSAGIALGTGSLGGVVGGTGLQTLLTTLATAVATAASLATVETAAFNALSVAINTLASTSNAIAASSTTTVG
jgi:hypothetical protein